MFLKALDEVFSGRKGGFIKGFAEGLPFPEVATVGRGRIGAQASFVEKIGGKTFDG
ncbi:hypothetical protein MASR2M79_14190 [Aminivibrio sp.]